MKLDSSPSPSPKHSPSSPSAQADQQQQQRISINVSVSLDASRQRSDSFHRQDRPDERVQFPPPQIQFQKQPPALASDRSSKSPPSPHLPQQQQQQRHFYPPPPHPDQLAMQAGYATTEAYGFHHQPPPPHYYGSRYPQPYPSSYSYPPASYPVPPSPMQDFRAPYQSQSYPPPANNMVGYTDDAATKLTDRVRRKCYNCRTTDTSTWRRSNLTPGKVLCNKCGLFERTHLRPRPEQFPHKRGPMSTGITKPSRTNSPNSAKMSPMLTPLPPSGSVGVHHPHSHPSSNGGPSASPPYHHSSITGTPPAPGQGLNGPHPDFDNSNQRQMHQRDYPPQSHHLHQQQQSQYGNGGGSLHNSPHSSSATLPSREGPSSSGQQQQSPQLTLPSLSRSSSPPLSQAQSGALPYSRDRL